MSLIDINGVYINLNAVLTIEHVIKTTGKSKIEIGTYRLTCGRRFFDVYENTINYDIVSDYLIDNCSNKMLDDDSSGEEKISIVKTPRF